MGLGITLSGTHGAGARSLNALHRPRLRGFLIRTEVSITNFNVRGEPRVLHHGTCGSPSADALTKCRHGQFTPLGFCSSLVPSFERGSRRPYWLSLT
ncbi:MAG: hypothetical protein RL701_3749 [Pseudomonadota bacterium]